MIAPRYYVVGIRQCVMRRAENQEMRWFQQAVYDCETKEVVWEDVREYYVAFPDSPK